MLIEYTPAKDNDVTAARGHDGFIASYTAADQFTGTPPRGATRLDNTHARTLLAHPRSAGEEGLCFAVFFISLVIFLVIVVRPIISTSTQNLQGW